MKKYLSILLLAILVIGLFTGCGPKPEPSAPASTAAPIPQAPATEAPATEAPATEAPATEVPTTEAPATEAPSTAAPETEAPTTEAPIEPAAPPEPSPLLEGRKWQDCVIVVDGVLYESMKTTIPDLIENGWDFKLSDYGLKSTDKMQPNTYTYTSVRLSNAKYDGPKIAVGLVNRTNEALPYKECMIHGFTVEGVNIYTVWEESYSKTACYDFEIPGNLHRGATMEEIKAAYGEPESVYVNEGHYETLTYKDTNPKVAVELKVFYDSGLQGVSYSDSRVWR